MGLFKKSNKLISAIKELTFQNAEKEKRTTELIIINKELHIENKLLQFEKSERKITEDKIKEGPHDITERKKAEQLIKESEAKYRAFFENSMDGILLTVADGQILSANPAACEIFRMTEEEICNAGRYGLIDTSDPRAEALILERKLTGKAKGELTYKRKDGSTFPGEITSVLFTDSFGQERTSMIIRDITERKKVEENLSATSHHLQNALKDLKSIMDSSLDVICAVNEQGYFVNVSAASERVWGYKPDELIGKLIFDFVYHEDLEKTIDSSKNVIAGNISSHFENRYVHKNGSLVPIAWTANWDENNRMRYGVGRDITEKNRIEKIVEIERQQFYDLFLQAPFSMGILKGPDHVFEMVNDLYLQLIGKKNIIGKSVKEVIPEIESQGFIEILDNVYRTGKAFSINEALFRLNDEKGEITKYANIIYEAHRNVEGNIDGIFFFAVDITEHVISRNLIRESEQRYRTLFEQNLAGVYQSTINGVITNCNNAFAKMLKYDSPQELMEINASALYFSPEMRNSFVTQAIDQKQLYNYENVLKCKDGSRLHVIENISFRKDVMTGEEFFDGIIIDITDRKNMEETLLQSERSLREAQATAHVGSWELDFKSQVSLWSDEACRIYGLPLHENKQPYQAWLSFIHPDDMEYVMASIDRSQKTFSDNELNNRIILKDGTIKHIYSKFKYVFDDKGNATGLYGITHDVTQAKTAENEMKKLSMIARETINGVVICDKHENIVWVNNAFTKMYGYELNEVIGKNPGELLRGPETDIEDVKYITEMVFKKEPFSFEILNYKKNGDKIYIKVQVQFMFDDKGEVDQYFAIETDITRQKELEEKVELEKIIKQKQITSAVYAAQENERSEIGRELHDNVNQLLGATRIYIDMARTNKERSDEMLRSASAYTLNAIEEIRKLSKTLITPLIKEIGFTDLVKDLAGEIMLIHPVQILFTANDFIDSAWNDKFQLNIFRIIQEQLNNIIKHAGAKKIFISIKECENKILVAISDDGIGFDTTKRAAGVGITNIKSRSELFNGIVLLTSEPGKGTSLSITFHKTELTKT
jgi:PAS domain S-box-containing protein